MYRSRCQCLPPQPMHALNVPRDALFDGLDAWRRNYAFRELMSTPVRFSRHP